MGIKDDSVMANGRHGCPEAEQLAAYLDRSLTGQGRRELERHAAECQACRWALAAAAAYAVEETADEIGHPKRFAARRPWFIAAGVLAVAASFLVVVRISTRPPGGLGDGEQSQWPALVAAISREPTRSVDGRLSGFGYSPPPPVTRGVSDQGPSAAVRIAAAAIERESAEKSAPTTRRELGVALLVVGDLDRAIPTLESVVHGAPDANGYNDLSAAYLARAQRTGQTSDLISALAAARRAHQIDANNQAAWFNEALILDASNRRADARAALGQYLKLDRESPWAGELRKRLGR